MNTPMSLNHKLRKKIEFYERLSTSLPKDAHIDIDVGLFKKQSKEPHSFNLPLYGVRYWFNKSRKEWMEWEDLDGSTNSNR